MLRYEPTFFMWMAFLTGYVLPKAYYEKVGAEGFEKKPIGTGPYMVDEYQGNAFLRLKANPNYWGGKPAFETVIFKFVPDATTRVAEIESGSSDVTLEVPYEEFDRLKNSQGPCRRGHADLRHRHDLHHQQGPDARQECPPRGDHAIDKKAIVDRLLLGYGVPIDTLEAPEYAAFDPSIKTPYDPKKATELLAASGFSPEKPVKFTIQTTRGFKPKDYEMIQAIVGMWRKVGIEAEIEVYEIAKHFELRTTHKLAPAAFYNWGNAIGDPTTSTGFAMFGPSPHSGWKTDDLDAKIGPLWGEKDEKKRIEGWKAVDKYIAEQGYVIPLLQYVQPMVYKSDLKVIPNNSGALQPTLVSPDGLSGRQGRTRSAPSPRGDVRATETKNDDRARDPEASGGAWDAGRRRHRRLPAAARRSRRPDRDDDLAGRERRRYRGAPRPLRARRQPALAIQHLGPLGARRRLRRLDLAAPRRAALLGERLPATLELAIAALEFAVIVGGAVAIVGAMARRTARSR